MIVPGYMQDVSGGIPDYLVKFLGDELWTWQTLAWWKDLWEKSDLVTIDAADTMESGGALWLRWEKALDAVGKNRHPDEIEIYEQDNGDCMGFIRMVATKK